MEVTQLLLLLAISPLVSDILERFLSHTALRPALACCLVPSFGRGKLDILLHLVLILESIPDPREKQYPGRHFILLVNILVEIPIPGQVSPWPNCLLSSITLLMYLTMCIPTCQWFFVGSLVNLQHRYRRNKSPVFVYPLHLSTSILHLPQIDLHWSESQLHFSILNTLRIKRAHLIRVTNIHYTNILHHEFGPQLPHLST